LVETANVQRRRLVREADNDYLVVWSDLRKVTKKVLRKRGVLRGKVRMPAAGHFQKLVRKQTSIRARPGKRRISRTRPHEIKRLEQALAWQRHPKSWWEKDIHAYIDNKKFVLARTKQLCALRPVCRFSFIA
jgi:hypothetical protein